MVTRRQLVNISSLITAALLTVCTALPAHADESISATVDHAQAIIGTESSLTMSATEDPETIISDDGNITVTAIEDAGLQVESMTSNQALIIPDTTVDTPRIEDGMAIAEGSKVSYAVDTTQEDAVMVHSILENKYAPERYTYRFTGVDWIMIDEQTGMAILFRLDSDGAHAIGGVNTPWAVDANGRRVPTHFESTPDGNTLIQVVEHHASDFTYPITADPQWWDNVASWFKSSGSFVSDKARSAARWLGESKSRWLKGKTWSIVKKAGRGAKVAAKKIGPGGLALCAAGAGWAWYRSDAQGWVRVGDAVSGCLL